MHAQLAKYAPEQWSVHDYLRVDVRVACAQPFLASRFRQCRSYSIYSSLEVCRRLPAEVLGPRVCEPRNRPGLT